MWANKIGADTMLARIVAMVADAQLSRAPIQRLADTVAGLIRAGRAATRRARLRCLVGLGADARAVLR